MLKVFVIDAYAVPATVVYRQVAFSSVARVRFVCVVPAASTPLGCPLDRTGGVTRGPEPEPLNEPPVNVRILAVEFWYTATPGCPVV